MYSTKGVGSGMEPQGATTLTGYYPKDFASRTNQNHLLQRNDEISLDTRPERFEFVKKINMPNHVESLGYITCYSSSSPIPFQTPSNYIRWNCYKICSWKGRPETTLKISKKWSVRLCKFCWDFTKHKKKSNTERLTWRLIQAVLYRVHLSE